MNRLMFTTLFVVAGACTLSAEQQWGDLVGRVVLQGNAPAAKKIEITTDASFFTKPVFDESLDVNKDNRGIANVLVYLREKKSSKSPVHPSYEKSVDAKVKLKMADGRFEPHVMLLRTTQTMLHVNEEKIGYNPRIDFLVNHAQ